MLIYVSLEILNLAIEDTTFIEIKIVDMGSFHSKHI